MAGQKKNKAIGQGKIRGNSRRRSVVGQDRTEIWVTKKNLVENLERPISVSALDKRRADGILDADDDFKRDGRRDSVNRYVVLIILDACERCNKPGVSWSRIREKLAELRFRRSSSVRSWIRRELRAGRRRKAVTRELEKALKERLGLNRK